MGLFSIFTGKAQVNLYNILFEAAKAGNTALIRSHLAESRNEIAFLLVTPRRSYPTQMRSLTGMYEWTTAPDLLITPLWWMTRHAAMRGLVLEVIAAGALPPAVLPFGHLPPAQTPLLAGWARGPEFAWACLTQAPSAGRVHRLERALGTLVVVQQKHPFLGAELPPLPKTSYDDLEGAREALTRWAEDVREAGAADPPYYVKKAVKEVRTALWDICGLLDTAVPCPSHTAHPVDRLSPPCPKAAREFNWSAAWETIADLHEEVARHVPTPPAELLRAEDFALRLLAPAAVPVPPAPRRELTAQIDLAETSAVVHKALARAELLVHCVLGISELMTALAATPAPALRGPTLTTLERFGVTGALEALTGTSDAPHPSETLQHTSLAPVPAATAQTNGLTVATVPGGKMVWTASSCEPGPAATYETLHASLQMRLPRLARVQDYLVVPNVRDSRLPVLVLLYHHPSPPRTLSCLSAAPALTPAEGCCLARDVLLALASLHGQGLAHLDLRPAAVLVERRVPAPAALPPRSVRCEDTNSSESSIAEEGGSDADVAAEAAVAERRRLRARLVLSPVRTVVKNSRTLFAGAVGRALIAPEQLRPSSSPLVGGGTDIYQLGQILRICVRWGTASADDIALRRSVLEEKGLSARDARSEARRLSTPPDAYSAAAARLGRLVHQVLQYMTEPCIEQRPAAHELLQIGAFSGRADDAQAALEWLERRKRGLHTLALRRAQLEATAPRDLGISFL